MSDCSCRTAVVTGSVAGVGVFVIAYSSCSTADITTLVADVGVSVSDSSLCIADITCGVATVCVSMIFNSYHAYTVNSAACSALYNCCAGRNCSYFAV